MTNDIDVLRGNDKIVVETEDESRYTYRETENGDYKWDNTASTVQQFPYPEIETAVAEHINGEVLDVFPLTVTVNTHSDDNTTEMCKQAGLPVDDDGLIDRLWNYPGSFSVTYEITESYEGHTPYDVEALEIEYEGEVFTPES